MSKEIKVYYALARLQENEPNSNYKDVLKDYNLTIKDGYEWLVIHLTYKLEELITDILSGEYQFYKNILSMLKSEVQV